MGRRAWKWCCASLISAALCLASGSLHAVTITQLTWPCSLCPWYDFESSPEWSPDGKNIAYTSAGVDLNYWLTGANVSVYPAPGEPEPETPDFWLGQQSLQAPPHTMTTSDPTWAPDGLRLACRAFDGRLIVLVDGDSTVRDVPAPPGFGWFAWAPQGEKIVASYLEGLATIDVSTGLRTWIPTGLDGGLAPAWSPDGQWIAFSSNHAGSYDLWIVAAAGGVAQQVTTDPARDVHPSWSPDGESLAFASDRSGNMDIWIIHIASREALQVTTHTARDDEPDWSPDGRRIVFVSERDASGFSHLWLASDLHTLAVQRRSWSDVKRGFREED